MARSSRGQAPYGERRWPAGAASPRVPLHAAGSVQRRGIRVLISAGGILGVKMQSATWRSWWSESGVLNLSKKLESFFFLDELHMNYFEID